MNQTKMNKTRTELPQDLFRLPRWSSLHLILQWTVVFCGKIEKFLPLHKRSPLQNPQPSASSVNEPLSQPWPCFVHFCLFQTTFYRSKLKLQGFLLGNIILKYYLSSVTKVRYLGAALSKSSGQHDVVPASVASSTLTTFMTFS